MSYSEEICEKSLHLIFEDGVSIIRNHRPNWLKNPLTNKNLELDFYIPHINLAIEIQGPHHYDDVEQIKRDESKQKLIKDNNVTLIMLSIFQISPSLIRRKIVNYTNKSLKELLLKPYHESFQNCNDIKEYKRRMEELYGKSKCMTSPYMNEYKSKRDEFLEKLDIDIFSKVEYNYKGWRITPIEIHSAKKVKCRILGTDKIIFVDKIKNLGLTWFRLG